MTTEDPPCAPCFPPPQSKTPPSRKASPTRPLQAPSTRPQSKASPTSRQSKPRPFAVHMKSAGAGFYSNPRPAWALGLCRQDAQREVMSVSAAQPAPMKAAGNPRPSFCGFRADDSSISLRLFLSAMPAKGPLQSVQVFGRKVRRARPRPRPLPRPSCS